MKPRVSEREVVCGLLKTLDLPFDDMVLDPDAKVIQLFMSSDEWDTVKKRVGGMRLDEITEAWRELPAAVWTDDRWVDRVCIRVCSWATDYKKLIMTGT